MDGGERSQQQFVSLDRNEISYTEDHMQGWLALAEKTIQDRHRYTERLCSPGRRASDHLIANFFAHTNHGTRRAINRL